MRVVIDEGVPRQLVRALRESGLDADYFDQNWRGEGDKALIALAEKAGYDVLLTNDKNIADQQSLRDRSIAVVALPLNRRTAIMARVGDIADTLARTGSGQHVVIGLDGSRTAMKTIAGRTVVERLPDIASFKTPV